MSAELKVTAADKASSMTALASKGKSVCPVALVLELTAITLQLAPRKLYRTSICSRLCEEVRSL